MDVRHLYSASKALRNENCRTMESFGAEEKDSAAALSRDIIDLAFELGVREPRTRLARGGRIEEVARQVKMIQEGSLTIHYATNALCGALHDLNSEARRHGATGTLFL